MHTVSQQPISSVLKVGFDFTIVYSLVNERALLYWIRLNSGPKPTCASSCKGIVLNGFNYKDFNF